MYQPLEANQTEKINVSQMFCMGQSFNEKRSASLAALQKLKGLG